LRIASALLARCSELDVVLEVESGVVGGEEDGIVGPANGRDELYTTSSDLLRVADVLGIGERGRYLLAATFGNVHGNYAPGNVVLRPEMLQAGRQALTAAYSGRPVPVCVPWQQRIRRA
ncbi:MAG: class II fructose-bisphosphate aldolase, partial [Trebonia sp.]